MRRKRMRLVSLILSAVCLLGCAVQPAPVSDSSESNTKVSAYAASQAEQNEEERTEAESLLPQTEDGGDTSESNVAPERAGAENADNAAEKQPTTAETAPPTTPEQPATPGPVPEDTPAPAPTPAPTQKPAEKQEEEPAPAPTPEPTPTPKPAASGNIYSIAEAVRAGNDLMLVYGMSESNKFEDTGAATLVLAMRQACKNILYTVGNSGYYADPTAVMEEEGADNMTRLFTTVNVSVCTAAALIELAVVVRWLLKRKKAKAA